MGDHLFDRKADADGALEELDRGRIFADVVGPGTNQGDLLVADIKVRVDGARAVVYEETDFAKAAAALPDSDAANSP